MTAVFGTPIAAVLLAVELLLFELRPRSLAPVAVARAVAGFLRPLLIEAGPLFPLHTQALPPSALLSCLIADVVSTHFHDKPRHRAYPVMRSDTGALVGMLDREGAASRPDAVRVGDLFGVNLPLVALADETCRAVATRLAVHGAGRLPVVADMQSRRLVGIISHSDLVKPALGLHTEELERETVRRVRFFGARRADVG